MDSQLLSNQELRRYRRQIMIPGIGESGQEKLKKSKVIIIGAGGIGTSALQYLAVSGVGELGICDNNIIEEENFQNQVLYNSLDLGKQKAIISKLKLEGLNNFNHYSIFNIFISSENAPMICSDFEIVIDATNDRQIGLVLDETCNKLQIPLIYAEKKENGCKISVFNYLRGPRLIDFYKSQPDYTQIFIDKIKFGSFGVMNGIMGNIMAFEAIKIITGIGKVLSNMYLLIDPINLMVDYKDFE
jgi:sulfur-carrier protein adenylyltransferase/sulfurtransferase